MSEKEMKISELKDWLSGQTLAEIMLKTQILDEDDIKGDACCCLFHDEDTPSMHIYDDHYYCYGCGVSGDAFTLVEKLYDFSFIQAAGFIADAYGITLKSGSFNPFLHQDAVSYAQLENEWQEYRQAAMNKIKEDPAFKAKVKEFYPLEVGWDNKINYLVLKYTSKAGKTLGFTKRRYYDDQDTPKWKHSTGKNSRIGECHNIYNLGNAVQAINKDKAVILVEGPKDIIPFLMKQRKNVVAVSGTSNVNKIFETLPEVDEVTLAFDGDEAGKHGEQKIISILVEKMPLENIHWIDFGDLDPYDYYYANGKTIPEEAELMDLFSDSELRDLYILASPYNQEQMIKKVSEVKDMSYTEAKSFFDMKDTDLKEKKEDELKKLVSSNDENAMRKLALKYDIE